MMEDFLANIDVDAVSDAVLQGLGALVVAMSALAAVLPKNWKLTQLLGRLSVDLRGVAAHKADKE